MKKKDRIFAVAAAILLMAAMGFWLFGSALYETKVSYGDFIVQLDEGKIEKAGIDETAGKITYRLKGDRRTYYTAYPDSENFKERMLQRGVELTISNEGVFRSLSNALSLLLMFILIIMVFGFMKPGNKFKIINRDNIDITFDDVAGNEEIKEELILISRMMKDERYRRNGAKIPKGILLQGPPGNGKTLLARAFAGETGVNLIAATSGDFSSQFIGIGSMKIRQLFRTAKRNAPCVIFIDEIDGVGAKRMNAQQAADKEMNTILTSLLNEMDGFVTSDNIMVLAATNRTQDLDDALTRPGRFDRQFIMNPPDKATRLALLRQYTKDSKLDGEIDFDALAVKTYGFSSAQIESLCNEAILVSVTREHDAVTAEDFEQAILKTALRGSPKKQASLTEFDRNTVAYHEAGHAIVAAHYTDDAIASVSIRPTTAGAGGYTMTQKGNENQLDTLENLYGKIKKLYGGRAAEYLLNGEREEKITTGAAQDIKEVTQLAALYINLSGGVDLAAYGEAGISETMKKTQALLEKAWAETVESLKAHWDEVQALAALLLEQETVSGEALEEIVK